MLPRPEFRCNSGGEGKGKLPAFKYNFIGEGHGKLVSVDFILFKSSESRSSSGVL